MTAWTIAIVAFLLGGFVGVLIMSLMSINRQENEDEEDLTWEGASAIFDDLDSTTGTHRHN